MKIEEVIEMVSDPFEESMRNKLRGWFVAEDSFLEYFEEVEEEGALPDLYGKNLLVSKTQFSNIFNIVEEIASFLKIKPPLCFIYDSQKYLIDSEGIGIPRLEISSRLVKDFNAMELKHVLAKEIFHIKKEHIREEVLCDKTMNLFDVIPNLPGINLVKSFGGGIAAEATAFHFKNIAFNWFKLACYSAENFAITFTGSIKDSINATLLMIFNEREMVDSIDINNYLNQIDKIESCIGPNATIEKINEVIPYGPYRVLNMLRFVLTNNGRVLFSYFKKGGK